MKNLSYKIKELKKEIVSDSYSMSIGELISLYSDEELDIHPRFQRLFRWSSYQKTRFIESILLNIPIPPLFVSQNEEGIWDVIDGVQRLSTIFQFVGKLKDQDGKTVDKLALEGTKALPELEGVYWESDSPLDPILPKDVKLDFKRARIVINIVKKESDTSAKYELFQRLNTGGSNLSDQEVRNCLMIMSSPTLYDFVERLSLNEDFIEATPISSRLVDEQYRMELITRYLIAVNCDLLYVRKEYKDLAPLLDEKVLELCDRKQFNYEAQEHLFNSIFKIIKSIDQVNCEDVFKKHVGNRFTGPVSSAAFLTITVGLANAIQNGDDIVDNTLKLSSLIKELYLQETFTYYTRNGARAVDRFEALTSFGKEYFSGESEGL
ncbi:MAG: DUF262 domain-containing protein [Clostridium sp.]|nr:DUF262 domain-containing protein [Clostridium sp.]